MNPEPQSGVVVANAYRLESPLGEGGFGAVWRATEVGSGQAVAVKVLKGSFDRVGFTRFEREAEALRRINHPNCLRFLNYGYADEIVGAYLVTELVDGDELRAWAKRDHSVDQIVDVGTQLASVLAAAHRAGVVHRDLKPQNIMVTDSPDGSKVTVLDFGIARLRGVQGGDITETGQVIGTPGYMSPEQLRGRSDIGPATDVYGLGVILFELLHGNRLFTGATAFEIAMKHLDDEPPAFRRQAPDALVQLIYAMLSKDPADRPAAKRVWRVLNEVAGHALPAAPTVESAQKSLLIPILIGATVAALIVAAVLWPAEPKPVPPSQPRITGSSLIQKPVDTPTTPPPLRELAPAPARVAGSVGCDQPRESGLQGPIMSGIKQLHPVAYLPADYDPSHPHPLLVLIPGIGTTAREILTAADLEQFADQHRVIVAAVERAENSALVRRILVDRVQQDLAELESLFCIDPERVYLFGHRGGGRAIDEIVCRIPVAGAITLADRREAARSRCRGKGARLVLSPTNDPATPVQGTTKRLACQGALIVSLDQHEAQIQDENGCHGPRKLIFEHGENKCYEWTCDAVTRVCHLDGGHSWPNSPEPGPECDTPAAVLPYQDIVWDFMQATAPPGRVDSTPPASHDAADQQDDAGQ